MYLPSSTPYSVASELHCVKLPFHMCSTQSGIVNGRWVPTYFKYFVRFRWWRGAWYGVICFTTGHWWWHIGLSNYPLWCLFFQFISILCVSWCICNITEKVVRNTQDALSHTLVRGRWQVKVRAKWYRHLRLHIQLILVSTCTTWFRPNRISQILQHERNIFVFIWYDNYGSVNVYFLPVVYWHIIVNASLASSWELFTDLLFQTSKVWWFYTAKEKICLFLSEAAVLDKLYWIYWSYWMTIRSTIKEQAKKINIAINSPCKSISCSWSIHMWTYIYKANCLFY